MKTRNTLINIATFLTAAAVLYVATTFQLPNNVPAQGRLASGNVMMLETSGTASEYKLYDLRGVTYNGVQNCASYAIIMADVANSKSHGIKVGQASGSCKPHDVIVINSTVDNSVQENNPPSTSKSWGSCIKVELGASNVEIRNNTVSNCFGEGIDAAEATNVNIIGNTLTNCWSYCIYIDNSVNVLVQDNVAYCPDTYFYRDGGPAVSFGVGDENLSKWGGLGVSIAANITIANNTSYGCKAAKYWGSQYSNGGVDGLSIINNTFYDTSTRVYASSQPRNKNIVLTGNVYLSSGSTQLPTATLTVTKTPLPATTTPTRPNTFTPSPTKPPTITNTITATLKSPTPTPTLTPTSSVCVAGLYPVNLTVQLNTYPSKNNMREDHSVSSRPVGNVYSDPGIRHSISWIWTDCRDYWAGIDKNHWFALRLNGVYFSDWRP